MGALTAAACLARDGCDVDVFEQSEHTGGVTATLQDEFRTLLWDAERAYPIREDNEFFTVSVPLALVRLAVLEAAQHLTRNRVLAEPEDVFFLLYDELTDALGGRQSDYSDTIGRRRRDLVGAEAFEPPGSYGEQPPQPPLDVLPPKSRLAMEAVLYSMERVFEPERSNHSRRERADRRRRFQGRLHGTGVRRPGRGAVR